MTRILFETGDFSSLGAFLEEYGKDYRDLAMRIVYKLEINQAKKEQYRGFKLFDIFGVNYKQELRLFLTKINPTLLALFETWLGQHA